MTNGSEDNNDRKEEKKSSKLLKALGMHIPEGKEDRLHIQPRFFKFLGFLGILALIFSMGMLDFSTSPYFCSSCHIMKPYYEAWETSSHNHVPCVDCHYPPELREKLWLKFQALSQVVKYVTRTYSSKPYAEISDVSCLRKGCHETRLLEGEVVFKRGIKFDHKPHLTQERRGKKLRCTSCHSQIVVGNHMEVTESTCFLCHFKGKISGREDLPIGGCPSCHTSPEEDIKYEGVTFNHRDFVGKRHVDCQNCHLDAIQGKGEAPVDRCYQCHNEEDRIGEYENVEFIHKNHVTEHFLECTHCHFEIRHKVRTAVEPLQYDCSTCHENKHNATKQIYMGMGAKGIEKMPSAMFLAQVDCIGCHKVSTVNFEEEEFTGQTFKASEAACIGCHGDEYEGVLDEWKQSVDEGLAEVAPLLEKATEITKAVKNKTHDYRNANILLNRARYNYRFITLGNGFHNADYALEVLDKIKSDTQEAMSLLEKITAQQYDSP
ncbi:MAG: NapC/NirT family cytochrome c [Deltaproteobacteria bacterium]|nr:NapC/NirT family cytochrome c [Deltaproteobacteria bacterium]